MTVDNVLLLTIDSLRIDALPSGLSKISNKNKKDKPPSALSALTVDDTTFEAAFATGPGTTPSFPALLTGTYPLSYGGLGPLTHDRPRVSTILRDSSRTTAGFQCNPFLSTHFNYDVGYDIFEDYQNPLMGVATKIFPRGIEINNPKLRRIDKTLHLTDAIKKTYQLARGKPRPYVSAEVITDDTVAYLDEVNEPFFCWTHYMDVHHPCFPPKPYRERHRVGDISQGEISAYYSTALDDPTQLDDRATRALRNLYDAAIEYVGGQIERIIDALRKNDLYGDTLIILTSDHGELFGEHGAYGKPERMYDELLHVPLHVVNGPDYLQEATGDLVSLVDVPPLIHDTLGLDVPDVYEGQVPGVDEPREYVMVEHEVEGDVIVGARSRDWLYEGDELRGEHRLFDIRNGGFERVPVEDHSDLRVRHAVLDRLQQLEVDTHRLEEEIEEEIEDDVEDRLEDLGYL